MVKFIAASLIALAMPLIASGDPISQRVDANALIETIAQRGQACGLLSNWEALSLKAMALEDRKRLEPDQQKQVGQVVQDKLYDMSCDNELLNVWIDGARRGFDTEMLPPYLVVYRTMATMEMPPKVFSATSLRQDHAPVLQAIENKLSSLSASGQLAEGGKRWPDYIAGTEQAAREFASSLETEGGDQAAAWIAQSALIVEAWFQEQGDQM